MDAVEEEPQDATLEQTAKLNAPSAVVTVLPARSDRSINEPEIGSSTLQSLRPSSVGGPAGPGVVDVVENSQSSGQAAAETHENV